MDEGGLDLPAAIQGLVMAALMKYATNAVALPWEVGKTLLQVQWVPRDGEPSESSVEPQEQDEDEAVRMDWPLAFVLLVDNRHSSASRTTSRTRTSLIL